MQSLLLHSLPSLKVRFWQFFHVLAVYDRHPGDRRYDDSTAFRKFKRQLYHASIAAILQPLQPGLTSPVVRRCPDGHFRRVIYDLIAFITDYPEQVMLTGIVQGWCPK